jgi:hypothetical protein
MRKELKTQLNELNTKYHETKLQLEKSQCSLKQLEQLKMFRRLHEERLKQMYSDDLMKLNDGKVITIK